MTATVAVGDNLDTVAKIAALPIGAVMKEHSNDRYYCRAHDGTWASWTPESPVPDNGPWNDSSFSLGYNELYSLPSGKVKPTIESLAQYRWRFRINALRGACENGIGMGRVHRALDSLGVGLDSADHPAGPGVQICREEVGIPAGTVAYWGDPQRPDSLSIQVYDARLGWLRLYGRDGLENILTISAWGDRETPAWVTTEGTEADRDEILIFKAKAWRVGDKVRHEASWCGTYDNVISRAGVTAASVREAERLTSRRSVGGYSLGDTITTVTHAHGCPVGTIFGWIDTDRGRFAVYERTAEFNDTNAAGCRRIIGYGQNLVNFRNGSVILHLPGAAESNEKNWHFHLGRLADWGSRLPVGTIFQTQADTTRWLVCRDGRIASIGANRQNVRETGQYRLDQFGQDQDIYVKGYIAP